MSIFHFIESPYYGGYFYKECMGIFPGHSELSLLQRCQSILEISGVCKERFDCTLLSRHWYHNDTEISQFFLS